MYWFGNDLYDLYNSFNLEKSEKVAEIEFLLDVVGGIKYKDYILGKSLSENERNLIKNYIKERVDSGKPIQQVVGKAFFAGEIFSVNENTLIPRPETELIIQVLSDYFDKEERFKMLDIGSGSGCISIISSKSFPNAEIVGVDNCQQCVDIGLKNTKNLAAGKNVNFLLSDLFANVKDKFDVIVSNPPYISFSDKNSVQESVYEFEPHNALFARNEGYYFYEKIITEAAYYLCGKSVLIFEIGLNQEDKICKILTENNFNEIKIKKDFNNINRVISSICLH